MTDCVDCPDEQNYAAIALQLQETAMQAEACLYEVETKLREVTNPETIVITMNNAVNVANGVLSSIGQAIGTVQFANSPRINMVGGTNVWTPGVWEVGAAVSAAPTGAVTVNTIRALFIAVHRGGDPQTVDRYVTVNVETEPNDGLPVDLTATTTVVIGPRDEIHFYFLHDNAGSVVAIAAGALYWATRLSDDTALRVV